MRGAADSWQDEVDSLGRRRAATVETPSASPPPSNIWETLSGAASAVVGAVSSTLAGPEQVSSLVSGARSDGDGRGDDVARPNRTRTSAFSAPLLQLPSAASSLPLLQPYEEETRVAAAAAGAAAAAPPRAKKKVLTRRALRDYVVASSDSLAGLALRFRTNRRTLKRCNPSIMGNTVYAGQVLRVPDGAGSPVPSPAEGPQPSPPAPPAVTLVGPTAATSGGDAAVAAAVVLPPPSPEPPILDELVWYCAAEAALTEGTLTLTPSCVRFVAAAAAAANSSDSARGSSSCPFDFVIGLADITDFGALSHTHRQLGSGGTEGDGVAGEGDDDELSNVALGFSPSDVPVVDRSYLHILLSCAAMPMEQDLFLLVRPERVLPVVEVLKEQLGLFQAGTYTVVETSAADEDGAAEKALISPPVPLVATSPPSALPASAAQLFSSPIAEEEEREHAESDGIEKKQRPSALFIEADAEGAMLVPIYSPKAKQAVAAVKAASPPPNPTRLPLLCYGGAAFASQMLSDVDLTDIEAALPWASRDHDWELLYSLQLHGSTLETFISNVQREAPTLLLLHTNHNEVCGVFASESWQYSSRFRGSGETFIFSCRDRSDAGAQDESEFQAYRW